MTEIYCFVDDFLKTHPARAAVAALAALPPPLHRLGSHHHRAFAGLLRLRDAEEGL
jgi:hypothetical protein